MIEREQQRNPGPKVVTRNRISDCKPNITNICQLSNLSLSETPKKAANSPGSTFSASDSSETDSSSTTLPVGQIDTDGSECANAASEPKAQDGDCSEEVQVVHEKKKKRWWTHTDEKYLKPKHEIECREVSTGKTRNGDACGTTTRSLLRVEPQEQGGDQTCDNPPAENTKKEKISIKNQKKTIISSFKQQTDQRQTKSVRWSSVYSVIKVKNVKSKINRKQKVDGNVKTPVKPSISEIAGKRLYLKGIEREKRLALLRKNYHSRGKKDLSYKANSSTGNRRCCTETCQRLYNLSKPQQEDGKRRRENIIKCRKTNGKKRWIYSTRKISKDEATHLYRIGLRKWQRNYPFDLRKGRRAST